MKDAKNEMERQTMESLQADGGEGETPASLSPLVRVVSPAQNK